MSSSNKQNNTLSIVILPELRRVLTHSGDLGVKWLQWLEHWVYTETTPSIYNDKSQSVKRYCCHCVELIPDHAGILVKQAIRAEAQYENLVQLLNDHFADRDFKFELSEKKLWIVTDRTLPNGWQDIAALIGNNLYMGLGKSKSFSHWLSLINEIQMLLASSGTDFPFNGLWVSENPERMYKQGFHSDQVVLYDPDGFDYWIYGEQEALENWLVKSYEKVNLLRQSNENLVIYDGEHQWLLKSSDSLMHRFIDFFRKG